MKTKLSLLVLAAACGGGTPDTGGTGPDANHTGGGPDGSTGGIPAMITISGTAVEVAQTSMTPLAGVAVSAFAVADDNTALATATTDAQGNYSMSVATHGAAIDGYLKATKSGEVDTYVYPPAVLTADFGKAAINMVTTSTYGTLRSFEGGTAGQGLVIAIVGDAGGQPVAGAKVASDPAAKKYMYMDANGTPLSTTGTNTDGLAFMIDVPPTGTVTVSATKSGATFKSHVLKARADQLTTTLITE